MNREDMIKVVAKNSGFKFENLKVEDTFTFLGDKHIVVDIEDDRVLCYDYGQKQVISYNRNDELVKDVKRRGISLGEADDIRTKNVKSLADAQPGDIIRFLGGRWSIYVGKDTEGYMAVTLDSLEYTHYNGDYGTYNYEILDKDSVNFECDKNGIECMFEDDRPTIRSLSAGEYFKFNDKIWIKTGSGLDAVCVTPTASVPYLFKFTKPETKVEKLTRK